MGNSINTDPTDFFYVADPSAFDIVYILLGGVVLAPIVEEFIFRGFLFQGLRDRLGVFVAGVISTILFVMIHFQYDPWGMLSVGIMGAGAAYLTARTGSLKTAIAYHAVLNIYSFTSNYLIYQSSL